jgi:hypothetical protein
MSDFCETCPDAPLEVRAKGPHFANYCTSCGHKIGGWIPKAELGLERRSVSRSKLKPRVRALVLDRFSHTCLSCGASPPDVILHVDHLIPVDLAKRFGLYDVEVIEDDLNFAPMCEECNLGKGAEVFTARTIRLMYRALRLAIARQGEAA